MNLYPRSLLRLILLGWVLMALPLLLAIAFASLSLTRLGERSEAAVLEATQTARLGWQLEEDLAEMERLLRRFAVIENTSLLNDYAALRLEWRKRLAAFSRIPLLAPLATDIQNMLEREAATHQAFTAGAAGADLSAVLAMLDELRTRTFDLRDEANHLGENERHAFREEAQLMQERLLIAIALAFLFAAVLFWFGRRLLSRLLGRVERAVIVLGNNMLDRRIQLKGPEDLQWFGRRLDWLRRRLRALETERTRIMRHVSHELKTPLATLREGASLLNEGVAGPLLPQQAKIAGIMQGNALRLQALIDSLLKLQQAEHARERIEPIALRLDTMIQQILMTHQIAARHKSLRIKGTLAPLTIAGGQEEVTTIINNLLANAIKFSPEQGTIQLLLAAENGSAVLDVIDEGPGVPESDRERIFEPFYRTRSASNAAGTGLGLAIAREFVQAHRGTLSLMSATTGAHFRVTLPLASEDPA